MELMRYDASVLGKSHLINQVGIYKHCISISIWQNCTRVGSTSPWMMLSMEMYLAWLASFVRAYDETIMFFVCKIPEIKVQIHQYKKVKWAS